MILLGYYFEYVWSHPLVQTTLKNDSLRRQWVGDILHLVHILFVIAILMSVW